MLKNVSAFFWMDPECHTTEDMDIRNQSPELCDRGPNLITSQSYNIGPSKKAFWGDLFVVSDTCSQLCAPPFMFYSLDAKGDEGHADHEQIQDVKVISAKRALVEECPISSHLQGVTENKSMSGYWQDRETISLTYTNSPPTPTPFHTHITYVRTYIHAYIHTPPFPPAASLGQDSIKEQWEDWGRTERQDWKRTVLRKGLYNQLNTTKIFPVYDVQMAPFLTKILQSSIWNPLDQILSSCFYFHNSQVPHNLVMMSMEDFPGKQNSQPLQILPRC